MEASQTEAITEPKLDWFLGNEELVLVASLLLMGLFAKILEVEIDEELPCELEV